MGNTICQRLLSNNLESLSLKWKQIYNEVNITDLISSTEISKTITEIQKDHLNKTIKSNILHNITERNKAYEKSSLERSLHGIKGLINSSTLQKHKHLNSSKFLKTTTRSFIASHVNDFRLQISYLIHTWAAFINKKMGEKEQEVDLEKHPVSLIIGHFNEEISNAYKDELLLMSVKMFSKEAKDARKSKDAEKFMEYVELFSKLTAKLEDEAEKFEQIFTNDMAKGELYEEFLSIAMEFVNYLDKETFEVEKEAYHKLVKVVVRSVRIFESFNYFLTVLRVLFSNKNIGERVDVSNFTDQFVKDIDSNLGYFKASKEPLQKAKINFKQNYVRDYHKSKRAGNIFNCTKDYYILSSYDRSRVLIPRKNMLSEANPVKEFEYTGVKYFYFFKGQLHGYDPDNYYVGEIDWKDFRCKRTGVRMDRYSNIRGIHESKSETLEFMKSKWRFYYLNYFHFQKKSKDKGIALKIYNNESFDDAIEEEDEEKKKKLEDLKSKYIMTFLYYQKRTDSEYMKVTKETLIKDKDGKPYKGIVERNEENDSYKFSLFGEYIFVRNKSKVTIIHIESATVIAEQDFENFDGHDNIDQKLLRFNKETEEMEIYEFENSFSYNRALEVLLSKVKPDENTALEIKARNCLGMREGDDDLDADSVEISESEEEETQEEPENDKKMNKENYEILLLKILDVSLRNLTLRDKVKIEETINKANPKELQNLFYDVSGIDQKEEVYKQIYKFLKKFRNLESNLESSLLLFIMKSLEAHLEILNHLQKDPQCGIICSQVLLKKILKLLENYSVDEKFFSDITLNGFKTTKAKIIDLIIYSLRQQRQSSVHKRVEYIKSELKKMVQDDEKIHTQENFFKKLMEIKTIHKDSQEEYLNLIRELFEIFVKFSTEKIIPEEMKILNEVCQNEVDLTKHRLKNPNLQKNLNAFLNTVTSLSFYSNLNDILYEFLKKYFEITKNFEEICSAVEKKFESSQTNDQNRRIVSGFDNYFTSSITGNVFGFLVSFKEYSTLGPFSSKKDEKLEENERNIRANLIESYMSLIKIVKGYHEIANLNPELEEKNEDIEVKFTHNETFLKTIVAKEKAYDLVLLEGSKLPESAFIHVFTNHTHVGKERDVRRNLELIRTWCNENSHEQILNIENKEIYIVAEILDKSQEENLEPIKIQVKEQKKDWKSKLNFVNLAKICLSNISQNFFKEIKDIKNETENENEANNILSKMSQVNRDKLDKVLGSDIFESGIDQENFKNFDFEVDFNNPETELKTSRAFKKHLQGKLGISKEDLEKLDKHCETLQAKIVSRSIFSKLGGEIGFICSQTLFLTVLKHQSTLDMFVDDMDDEINLETYTESWLQCSQIRTVSRNFHTLRELVDLFRKISFLFSLEPSDTFSSLNNIPTLQKGVSSFQMSGSGANSRKSSLDSKKDGTDWTKVKKFLTSMREKKQEESPEKEKDLVSLIIKLVKIPIEVDSIIKILEDRLHKFNLYSKALQFMNTLYKGNKKSVLQAQILNTFESTFRNDSTLSDLTQLSLNYNGLPNDLIKEQILLIKTLVISTVDIICKEKIDDEQTILLALQNLKWVYKGRESECVLAIDPQRIWKSIMTHVEENYPSEDQNKNQAIETLIESTLELMEILMGYCVRKIQQQTLNQHEEEAPSLGLRRHVSFIDENSITTILNKNLKVLIREVGKAVEELDKFSSMSLQDYKKYQEIRRFKKFGRNSASNYYNTFSGSENLNKLSEFYSYEFDHEKIQAPEEKIITKKKIETIKNENGEEETKVDIKTETVPAQTLKTFSDYEELRKSMKDVIAKEYKIVEKILIILYNNILKIPQTALQLLDNDENVKILFKLSIESYPVNLQTIAINIVSELSKLTSFGIYNLSEKFLENLKHKLTDKTIKNEPLSQSYYENLLKLTRNILASQDQPQSERLAELLFEENSTESLELIFSVLRPNQFDFKNEEFIQGRLISLSSDIRNLKYILLSRNDPILYREYLRRNHHEFNPEPTEMNYKKTKIHFEKSKKFKNEENSFENLFQRFIIYKEWPILCLVSGTIKVVKQEEIVFENENPDEWKTVCKTIIDKFDVIERVKKSREELGDNEYRSLKILYKLTDILQDYNFIEYYEKIEELTKNFIEEYDQNLSFKVINEFGEKLTKLSYPKKKQTFKKVTSDNSKFKKFNSLLISTAKKSTKKNLEKNFNPKNILLSKSLAAKEIIDTKVFLSFDDVNHNDEEFCKKLLKKRIGYTIGKLKSSSINPTFETILSLWKNISTRASGFRRTKLETSLNILIDKIGNEDDMMMFLKEILVGDYLKNSSSDLESEKNLKETYKVFELVFKLAQRINKKNHNFFEDVTYKIFPLIVNLIKLYSDNNKFDNSAYSVNLLLLLVKHFKEYVQLLKDSKQTLDLMDETESIKEILKFYQIESLWNLDMNVRMNDDYLYSVFNNLSMNIFLNCKIDLEKLKEDLPKLVKRIKRLQYYDNELKKNTEIDRDIYIAKKFFEYASKRNSDEEPRKKLDCIAKTVEIDFNRETPLEVNLSGYKNWVVSLESKFRYKEKFINVYSDPEGTNKILGFIDQNDSDHKTIFKEKIVQRLPELDGKNSKLYINYEMKKDFYINFDSSYDNKRFYFSLPYLDFESRDAETTEYSNNNLEYSNNTFLYKGCLFFHDGRMNKFNRIMDGITINSGRFFYRPSSNEIIVSVERYAVDNSPADLTFCSNHERSRAMLVHYQIPEDLKIKKLTNDRSDYCFILFKNGNFGVVKNTNEETFENNFVGYLIDEIDKNDLVKFDQSENYLFRSNMVYECQLPEGKKIIHANCKNTVRQMSFLQIFDPKEDQNIFHFFKNKESIATVNFGKEVVKKSIAREVSTDDGNIIEFFILLENGELYYHQKENKNTEFMDRSFIINKTYNYPIVSTHEEFKLSKMFVRLHVKEAFRASINDIVSLRDQHFIMIKYKEFEDDGDFYQIRVYYQTIREDDKYKNNLVEEVKYLKLKENSPLLQEDAYHYERFILTGISPESQSIKYHHYGEEQVKRDFRRDLLDDGHKLRYPFIGFYNPILDKMEGVNLEEGQEEINLKEVVEKQVVRTKFSKLFDVFSRVQEDMNKQYEEYTKNGNEIKEPVKSMKESESKELKRLKKIDKKLKKKKSHFGIIFNRPGEDCDEDRKMKIDKKVYLRVLRKVFMAKKYLKPNKEILKEKEGYEVPKQFFLKNKNELTQDNLTNLKEYMNDLDDEKLKKAAWSSLTSFNQNEENLKKAEVTLMFEGKLIETSDFKEKLEKLGEINFEKEIDPVKVIFYPDVYQMDETEWKKFCKKSGPIWFSKKEKVTDEILSKSLEELHEMTKNRGEDEIKIPEISKYLKYQEMIISRMNTVNYADCCSRLASLFGSKTYDLNEMEKLPNTQDFDETDFGYWFYGFVWHNFKAVPFIRNQPIVENEYWEKQSIQKYKNNLFGTFETQFARTFHESAPNTSVNRIRGEKATYENQELTLLDQFIRDLILRLDVSGKTKRISNFYFDFIGEPGQDAGGLKREYLLLLTNEILDKLNIFVKSPNSVQNLGKERDKLVPDPNAVSLKDMDNFFKVGAALGCVMRSGDILSINLPSIFWKYLLDYELQWEDIKSINHSIYACLADIEKMPETDLEYLDEKFVTALLDGSEVELKPNGKNITLSSENKLEYINLVKEKNMNQFLPAFKKMKQGFYEFNFRSGLRYETPISIDPKLVGMNYVDIEQLKKITVYRNFDEKHEGAKRFWRVLESFDQKQLSGYLKYVWGRSRLSHGLSDAHKVSYYESRNNIPEAHTCFFELDLGRYESDEELRKKLLYGIENCNEIAEDGANYHLAADFGI